MKKICIKIISLMLTISILWGCIPRILAADYHNETVTAVEQELLGELAEIYGEESAAELLRQMRLLGLVDDNGNSLKYTILMNGSEYSADEIEDMLDRGAVSSETEVTVDGQTVILGDLKKMFDIEREIARLYEKYTDNAAELTPEHELSLTSLIQQLETQGIMMYDASSGNAIGDTWVSQNARVSISTPATVNPGSNVTITVTLSESPVKNVTLKYKTLDGAAVAGTHYNAAEGIVTFAAGDSMLTQTVTTKTIPVPSGTNGDYTKLRWQGERAFLVQFYDIENALFSNDKQAIEFPVKIKGDFTYSSDAFKEVSLLYSNHTSSNSSSPGPDENDLPKMYGKQNELTYDFTKSAVTNGSSHLPLIKEYIKEGIITSFYMSYKNMCGWNTNMTMKIICQTDVASVEKQINTFEYIELRLNFYDGNTGATLRQQLLNNDTFKIITTAVGVEERETGNYRIDFQDTDAPKLNSVTAPAETYTVGQTVPVTATFSEPVKAGQLKLDDETSLDPVESSDTISYRFTYLYTVKDTDNATLSVCTPDAKDIAGNSLSEGNTLILIDGVKLDTPDKKNSFTGLSTDKQIYEPNDGEGTITVQVNDFNVDETEVYKTWLVNDIDKETDIVKSIKASVDGGKTLVNLKAADNNINSLTGTFRIEPSKDYKDMRVELYMVSEQGKTLFIGNDLYADFAVKGAILIEAADLHINYPAKWFSGVEYLIYDDADEFTKLGYTLDNPLATFQGENDFVWSVEPDGANIASIDADGTIRPTNNTYGKIIVNLTATNGGLTNPVIIRSAEIEIRAGNDAFLKIPAQSNHFAVLLGKRLTVSWASNITYKNQKEKTPPENTTFTLKLYEGNHTLAQLDAENISPVTLTEGGNGIWNITNENQFLIPDGILNKVSINYAPAYTFTVEAKHPETNDILKTIGYIVVTPEAVKLKLNHENVNRFMLDTETAEIQWTMLNFDTVNASNFEFAVYKGANVVANSKIIFDNGNFTSVDANADGGSCTFTPDKVSGDNLMDVYTVELRAKNSTNSTWSYDSLVMYVYNSAALDILVDGAKNNDYTMSNINKVNKGETSENILKAYYGDELKLRNMLSINYKDYDWQLLYDQIKWNSSNSSAASINYRQGSLYENIENFNYETYGPNTEFILSGLADDKLPSPQPMRVPE